MVLGGGDHTNKGRRKTGLLDPKLLGYTKSMMWYPQARLQPAAQGSSPNKLVLGAAAASTVAELAQRRPGSPSAEVLEQELEKDVQGGDWRNDEHPVDISDKSSPYALNVDVDKQKRPEKVRSALSLETWAGRAEPRSMPIYLAIDADKLDLASQTRMPWGVEGTGSRVLVEDEGEHDEEVLTARAAEIIEERVARAPSEIQRLDDLMTRVRGQQRGISRLLYMNIDTLRRELPIKFLLSLKASGKFPEFNVQVIRDRAYLMLAAWAEEMRLRAMARALVPWWQLVVRQRAKEYRAGVGVRLLKATLYRMTLRLMRRKIHSWIRWAAWQRFEERNAAALQLQKQYRGYKGRMEFLELLRRHLAAIPIQTCWRRVWALVNYRIDRANIITSQRIARGLIVRRLVAEWHRSATMFQTAVRMFPRRVEYLMIAESIVKAQTIYRAWLARKVFYHYFELKLRKFEVEMTMAAVIQRNWRGVGPRVEAKRLREEIKRREAAALHIQNWWYRVQDGFASFFLMRLLSVQEEQGLAKEAREKKQKRLAAVALVQRRVRGWKARRRVEEIKRKGRIAASIQKIYRGRSTRHAVARYKKDRSAVILIQRFYRDARKIRNAAARTLQRMYLVSGRPEGQLFDLEKIRAHVKSVADRIEAERRAAERRAAYSAARLVQKMIRRRRARKEVLRIKAAIHIQSFFRVCLARAERMRRYLSWCHETGMRLVVLPTLREALARASNHVRMLRKSAATRIQTRIRIYLAISERLARADYLVRATASSLVIQNWWRNRLQSVIVANMTELAECAKGNIFRDVVDREGKPVSPGEETAHQMLSMAITVIERYIALVGVGKSKTVEKFSYAGYDVATLFLRLGLGDHAGSVKKAIHEIERKLLGKGTNTSIAKHSPKKKRRFSQKGGKNTPGNNQSTDNEMKSSSSVQAAVSKSSDSIPSIVDTESSRGLSDPSTKPNLITKTGPLPPDFPKALPSGSKFAWLRCRENGEIQLLRSLLQVEKHRDTILMAIAEGSPRALKAEEAKLAGKKVRANIKKEKVKREDGSIEIIEIDLDAKHDMAYATEVLSRVEMLLGLIPVPSASATDRNSNKTRQLYREVSEGFSLLDNAKVLKGHAAAEFKRCYPRNANRAGRFANKCPLGAVSLFQLRAYLERFGPSGASRAFDSFEMLTKEWPGWERKSKSDIGLAAEARHWNNVRTRRGFELVQMCAERFCGIVENGPFAETLQIALRKARRKWHWRRPWVQESNLLYQCPKKAPGQASLQKPLKILTDAIRYVMQADQAAQRIQLRYRARLTTLLYRNIKSQLVLARANAAYHKEIEELYNGTKVRAVAEADRIKEKREYQIFLVEQEHARREEALWYTVAWPYEEVWDDSVQAYVYYRTNLKDGEEPEPQYEKPVYTVDQENNVIKLQKWARWLREMRLMKEWTRRDELARKEGELQAVWETNREARERLVTIKLNVVDAEPGFLLSVGIRPTVNVGVARHPQAQTLSQTELQLERLQDYVERIESRVVAQSSFPEPKLLPTGKYAPPPPAPSKRLIKHFQDRIADTAQLVKDKEKEKRDADRLKRRKGSTRPKSRDRNAAKLAAMTRRQRAKFEKKLDKEAVESTVDTIVDQQSVDEVDWKPKLQPLFPSCCCMLNSWCWLPHGHSGPHQVHKAGLKVVTPFGPGELMECRSLVEIGDYSSRVLKNNQLVAEAILLFWEDSVKKQRAPSLPKIPSPSASLTTNAAEIRASIQTIPSRVLKQLLEGVRTHRASMEKREIERLGHCSDAQCIEVIANEMRAIKKLEKKIKTKAWQDKNRILSITMATKNKKKVSKTSNGRAKKSSKGGQKQNKTKKGAISGIMAAQAGSPTRMTKERDPQVLLKKPGLFGTSSAKFFSPMCRVRLKYGVAPVKEIPILPDIEESTDGMHRDATESYQKSEETQPHNENYAIAMVRKEDMKWYPPKPAKDMRIAAEIKYTLVEMPLGWVEVQNYDGSVFYANENTGETTWDRPEYSVKEDLNAITVQRFMRGWYGRVCFKRMLRNTSMLDIVSDCVKEGSLTAWIGYGMEGMDVELYLNRLAMYELCPLVQRWRKDRAGKRHKIKGIKGRVQLSELLEMDDVALQKLGVKNKIYRKRLLAMNQRVKQDAESWDQDSIFFTPRYPKLLNKFQLHGSRFDVPKRKHYSGLLKDLPELPAGCVLEQGEIIDLGEEFGYLAPGDAARSMFLSVHKSHEKRADEFPNAIEDSETPVTFSMVHAYLTKHGGRAKAAADHASDLQNFKTISPPEMCAKVCRLYYRCAERLIMILKKLKLPTLRWKLVQALRIVSPMMRRLAELDREREETIKRRKEEAEEALKAAAKGETRKVKSPKSAQKRGKQDEPKGSNGQDRESEIKEKVTDLPTASSLTRIPPGKQFQLPPGPLLCVPSNCWPLAMAVGQIIRDAMQWIFRFDRACKKVQFAFRCYVLKRDGRAYRRYVCGLMTKVQARWRGILGRRIGLSLRWQFKSNWEQLFDEKRHTYYFYNNQTRTSQWQAPFVPFRPFGWWPEPEPVKKALRGFCSRCFLEKATRQCHRCVDKDTSLPLEFCFACFAIAHRESAEMQSHGFEIIIEPGAGQLTCVECHDIATRKCLDCDDAYCKAHFQRMHRRGNRKKHNSYGFTVSAPVCVECENDVAIKFCNECRDPFCLNCYLHIHRKGKKKFHQATPQEDSITDGLDLYIIHVTEQRKSAKEKALAQSSSEEEEDQLKQAPTADPPISKRVFGKSKGQGRANVRKKPKKPPPKNLRRAQALSTASKAGSLPVRRNRPKNWRQLRPSKPPPPQGL